MLLATFLSDHPSPIASRNISINFVIESLFITMMSSLKPLVIERYFQGQNTMTNNMLRLTNQRSFCPGMGDRLGPDSVIGLLRNTQPFCLSSLVAPSYRLQVAHAIVQWCDVTELGIDVEEIPQHSAGNPVSDAFLDRDCPKAVC